MTKPIRCSLIVWAAFLITPALLVAQQKPLHINPVIAKLAEGKTVYGLNTGDLSLVYAREVARAPVDFVYADMEHNPLDFPALHLFLMGMTDKATIVKQIQEFRDGTRPSTIMQQIAKGYTDAQLEAAAAYFAAQRPD